MVKSGESAVMLPPQLERIAETASVAANTGTGKTMFDFLRAIDWKDQVAFLGAALAFGYLLGSIPFGLIFARAAGAGDVRKIGSGNIGATNVLRTGKRWAALATLLCDGGKGAVAVLAAHWWHGEAVAVFAALGAFLGHLFPVWLNFKGGKGVATFLGVTLALFWPVGLMALATWALAAFIWRMSSLSALLAAVLVPVYMLAFHQPLYATLEIILAILILYMHRENIRRILDGREPRIGASSQAA
ncbi:MAG: glycerol-3-phosphate 1-O-acyltransferase PlsY [Rhizomicrobium sp.]|jgi:glycerol-3-phosphate acyltransferase PlsY